MKSTAAQKTPSPGPKSSEIRAAVANWEGVAKFLRRIAEEISVVPDLSSDLVKSSLQVAVFLENRAGAVRKEHPKEFANAS